MTWLSFPLALFILLALVGSPAAETEGALETSWKVYQQRHILPDGRVVDDGNGGVSHSEGQGYALLLAAELDEPAIFARLWSWTYNNLFVRDDGLAAWRYDPAETPPITDINNASDGDLLIAHALILAGTKWQRADYLEQGRLLAESIREHLLHKVGNYRILLPGAEGFVSDQGYVVNPSYWIFHSLAAVREIDPDPRWEELYESGQQLLKSLVKRYKAVPDWIAISPEGELLEPEGFEWITGYNALRVPLYLRLADEEADSVFLAYLKQWGERDASLPVVQALSDLAVLEKSEDPGFLGLRSLLVCKVPRAPAPLSEASLYYPATLLLFTHLVWARKPFQC